MDKKCSKCGGVLVEGVMLDAASHHSVIFIPMEDAAKVIKRKTGVICDACRLIRERQGQSLSFPKE